MYFAVIDCGTTNSSVYILNNCHEVIGEGAKKIGVRDTAISGSNRVLKEGLKEVFELAVARAELSIEEIEFAIAFGMITSEIGLMELPHLSTPVGVDDLAKGIKVVTDPYLFPVNVPLILIRGVKNRVPESANFRDMRKIDFMRGEETQVAGLLSFHSDLEFEYPLVAVVLGSHTKFIHIDEDKRINGSLTTMSGQAYEAVSKETSIGKSIIGTEEAFEDYFNPQIIDAAYDSVMSAGFIRSLMMPRFMEVLLDTKWYERRLFIDAAIVADDLRALSDCETYRFSANCTFVLIGQKTRCEIFKYLLTKYLNVQNIRTIHQKEHIDRLGIEGAIDIARKAGRLD
ncbi:MAG TPA: hypothetical protein GX530_07940 [Corynebacteriales bacterium]|nr:hypothetical protein [Mycobacteriales bacterium]